MKKALHLAVILLLFSALPARADQDVSGDFNGKTKCENGLKKAGFKDPDTGKVMWYSLNEVSYAAQGMSWDDPMHSMDFDAREKRKTQLQHVAKLLRDLSCDASDNPAQSGDGLLPGAQNPTTNSTQSGVKQNGYVQPSATGQ